jgi:prophage DNA circulation protein
MLDNPFPNNINESSNSMNSSEDKIQISALQKETETIKLEHEFLKKKTYELINEVQQLRNQIQILNNENQNLRNNKGISPSESQIHEIIFLKNEVKRLSNELSNKKMNENSEFERYKQIKEEEINLYKLKLEKYKILNLQKEKEINELRLKLSNSNMIEKTRFIQDSCLEIVKGEIIHNNNELEFLTRKICDNKKKMTLNLLYKATVDSDKAVAFHNKCDGAKSTIVLVESKNGKRFGGFTTCDWRGNAIEKKDENAFVFSLDKMKAYNIIPGELAIGCYPKFGPVFLGCQIRIYDEAFIKGGTTFEKEKNYETQEDYELTGGLKKFEVKEIEVYSVELE